MSLYNQLFGMNKDAPVLLGMLGLNMEYFDRFRDVFLIDNGTKIIVYTRTGGDNRDNYQKNWEKVQNHELYIGDYDDVFDNTYAYIEFKIPSKYKETAKKMFKEEPMNVGDMFNMECKRLDNNDPEALERAKEIAGKILNGIENGEKFIGF